MSRFYLLCAFLFGLLILNTNVHAKQIAPRLMLEPGMHNAMIADAAFDPSGRWLVTTSSHDYSTRLWDTQDKRLLSVLRFNTPAQGDSADDGKMQAVAFSSDSRLIAVGGYARGANDKYRLALFERQTGRLWRFIEGFKRPIRSLAFSPDGKWLLVGQNAGGGLRLYSTETWESRWEDLDYQEDVYDIVFGVNEPAVFVANRTAELTRYTVQNGSLHRTHRTQSRGGNIMGRMALSPNGQNIAIGFLTTAQVYVHYTADLSVAWIPDTRSADRQTPTQISNLFSLAWSLDSEQLYAAGRWSRKGILQLRRWEKGGRGRYEDFDTAKNTITQILRHPDGRLLLVSLEPSLLWFSPDNKVTPFQDSPRADLRGNNLAVSADGNLVSFTYGNATIAAQFDLNKGQLTVDATQPIPVAQNGLLQAGKSVLRNWFHQANPILNEQSLEFSAHTEIRSAAMTRDGARVVLGSNTAVYLYDAAGTRLWETSTPSSITGLTISADQRWIVSANTDGTLRWLRLHDGSEALRLFLHADRQRWVAWRPNGEYFASAGGEQLFGWQINQASGIADFLPANRLRQTLWKANLGERFLNDDATQNTSASPVFATILPPQISILQPGLQIDTKAPQLPLTLSIKSAKNTPATRVVVRINGQNVLNKDLLIPVSATTGDTLETRLELAIPIPESDSQIDVFAFNRHGSSAPATLQVNWRDPTPVASAEPPTLPPPLADFSPKPRLYVLAVGVSQYAQKSLQLQFPARDARDFLSALKQHSASLYRSVESRLLVDGQASREAVLDGLEWLKRQTTHRDVAVLFLAGHGENDNDGTYYFLPHGGEPAHLKRSAIIQHEIRNTLAALPGKVLLFIDTCHAGNVLGTARRSSALEQAAMINEMASAENGVIVFSASTGRQYSLENPAWGNGAFTKALVEGISGAADLHKNGRVTHKMLDFYVSERVKALTQGQQTPVTIIPRGIPDFPIANPAASAAVQQAVRNKN